MCNLWLHALSGVHFGWCSEQPAGASNHGLSDGRSSAASRGLVNSLRVLHSGFLDLGYVRAVAMSLGCITPPPVKISRTRGRRDQHEWIDCSPNGIRTRAATLRARQRFETPVVLSLVSDLRACNFVVVGH